MSKLQIIASGLMDNKQAAIITSDVSRKYLTGFHSSAGTLIITKEKNYFIIDSRYHEKAVSAVTNCKVILQKDLFNQINLILSKHNIESVSIESRTLTVSELTEFIDKFPHIEFDSSSWLSDNIEKQRVVKTADEIKKIEAAQRIAEKAFAKLIRRIHVGLTEKQVAALLNYYMLGFGADGISFDTIIASGKNSSMPHAVPTDKALEEGDFVVMDFGAVLDGYHSDMTRTIVMGEPTDAMKRVYDAVLGANIDSMKAVKADVSGKLVDSVARATLEAWGYENYFGHSLGHGVGVEIHELPNLSPKSVSTLRENMVVTIEPGVYIPNKFGVRIEDMVVVTKNGCVNLTKTQKTLIYVK